MSNIISVAKSQVNDLHNGLAYLHEIKASSNAAPDTYIFKHGRNELHAVSFDRVLLRRVQDSGAGKVYEVKLLHGTYKGSDQFTLEQISLFEGYTPTPADFLPSLDLHKNWAGFTTFLKENVDFKFASVVVNLTNHPEIKKLIAYAFAGKTMHDAIRGGLISHILKMLRIAKVLIENDVRLLRYKDLIYTGIAIHDLGKALELTEFGQYHKGSLLGHRTMLVGIMYETKASILENIGEDNFEYLISVVVGHHGAYEDPPVTVLADIIHHIDILEARTTSYMDAYENGSAKFVNEREAIWSKEYNRFLFY